MTSQDLTSIRHALHDFEQAIVKHEHFHFGRSDVLEQQDIDRSRQRLLSVIAKALDEAAHHQTAAD
jgi:hypothetical protein